LDKREIFTSSRTRGEVVPASSSSVPQMQRVDPQAFYAHLATAQTNFGILTRMHNNFLLQFGSLVSNAGGEMDANISITTHPDGAVTVSYSMYVKFPPAPRPIVAPAPKVEEVPAPAQREEEEERIRKQKEEIERKRLEDERQRLEKERIQKQQREERQAQIQRKIKEEEDLIIQIKSHPVHRFRYPNGMHHFSQNYNEIGNGQCEGIACYSGGRLTFDVQRLYHPGRGAHYFTIDWGEKERFVRDGWCYEGVAFQGSHTGSPIWRIWQPNTGDVILTTNSHEFHALENQGWQGGCIMCYTYCL
jgi:hypothetical protein